MSMKTFIGWGKQLQAQWAENASAYDRQSGQEDKPLHYLINKERADTYHRCQSELGQLLKTVEENQVTETVAGPE